MSNKAHPHQAVILVRAEIMERLPSGDVSGRPVETTSKVFTVLGNTFEECKENLRKFLPLLEEAYDASKKT